jgi:thiol-disulfide isomerase/thioredoxin
MGKASRTKVDSSRREKIAAQRAAARRAEQRRRILIAGGSILAVIIVIVAFIVIKASSSPSKPTTTTSSSANGPTGSALASVVAKVTSVPASTLNTVGTGGGAVSGTPVTIKGSPAALTSGGKPEMLYMGAEYCPYCAAERWAMIVALDRFGTFSGLATVHSGIKNGAGDAEPDPSTPTWTFVNATYTSKYLTFTPVEMQTNIPDASTGSYTTLQTPTAAQNALITKYDAAPYTTEAGAIPFVDFGNKYLIIGASYDPGVLSGLSWSTVATDLSNPSSPVAKAVDGTANYITAALCKMTGNQPASACTSVVQSLESKI